MRQPPIRLTALFLALGAIALAGASTSSAGMTPATSGSLVMSSDPGDYIGQGQQYSFSTPADTISFGGGYGGNFIAQVSSANGDWTVVLSPPTYGTLVPGLYTDVVRMADDTHAGMDISGEGRGCNATTGSFNVLEATYGTYGYTERFHATFEQHCEGLTPALRGEIDLVAPPAPPAVELHVSIDSPATIDRSDGKVRLHGTITCSLQGTPSLLELATVDVALSQQTKKGLASASGRVWINECSATAQPWQITLVSGTTANFSSGDSQATADATAPDDWWTLWNQNIPINATAHADATVDLRPGS
jgi:hypothetical protein